MSRTGDGDDESKRILEGLGTTHKVNGIIESESSSKRVFMISFFFFFFFLLSFCFLFFLFFPFVMVL